MTKGWFVGNFEPSAFQLKECEVCCIEHKQGEYDAPHYHKIATEITLVTSGTLQINETIFTKGDIFVVEPGEKVIPQFLTDVEVVVVKVPSVPGDKYYE